MASPMASFTKQVDPRLAKHPLKTNGHLANLRLTSLVKEAAGVIELIGLSGEFQKKKFHVDIFLVFPLIWSLFPDCDVWVMEGLI